MCGICGVYSPSLTDKEIQAFQALLAINAFRGVDSTGVARVDAKKNVRVLRAVVPSFRFLRHQTAKDFISDETKPMLFLGHCRAATIGSISPKNTHPFNFPKLLGVMNGTFKGSFENSNKFDTDTEAIYHNINEKGLADGLSASMVYDPAYVLVWIDKQKGTINFIKNDKRDLALTYISGRKTLIWSSDEEHLKAVLNHFDFKYSGYGDQKRTKDIFTLHENDLLSISLGSSPTKARLTSVDVKKKVFVQTTTSSKAVATYTDDWTPEWEEYVKGDRLNPPPPTRGLLVKGGDGQYRTRLAEEKRLDALFSQSRVPNTGSMRVVNPPSDGIDPLEDTDLEDLKNLPWIRDTRVPGVKTKGPKQTPTNKTLQEQEDNYTNKALRPGPDYRRPVSQDEMEFKLAGGCCCCGNAVDPKNIEEVSRTVWWDRDNYACGDCFEHSDGDWVRLSFEDPQVAPILIEGPRTVH